LEEVLAVENVEEDDAEEEVCVVGEELELPEELEVNWLVRLVIVVDEV
jgi:hypothetical protein